MPACTSTAQNDTARSKNAMLSWVFSSMSRLPSSTNRPCGASTPSPASMATPESEFSTMSTPRPPVSSRTSSANAVDRESITCSTPLTSRR